MTNNPYPDSNSSRRNDLEFDEIIAILVAFATIGTIMWWSFSRRNSGWEVAGSSSPIPTATASTPPIFTLPTTTPENILKFQTQTDSQATDVEPEKTPSPSRKVTPDVFSSGVSNLPPQVAIIPAAIPLVGTGIKQPSITQPSPEVTQPSPSATSSATPSATPTEIPTETPAETKPPIPPPLKFNDVESNFWGRPFIDALSSRKMIEGFSDYNFRPNQPVNRAEFAAILQQAFKNTQPTKRPIDFKDIPATSRENPAINQAIRMGFLKGYPDKNFIPDRKIPRVEVLVSLVSGLNLPVPSNPNRVLGIYKDAQDIPKYATDKIAAATVNGLVVSEDSQLLEPNKNATRTEVAAMVHQALVKMGRLEPINSKNIVQVPKNSQGN